MSLKKLQVMMAVHYYPEAIDGIYAAAVQMKSKIQSDLVTQTKELSESSEIDVDEIQEELSPLADDLFLAEITTDLAGEMLIIALHKTVEISIRQMAKISGLFADAELEKLYFFKKLKETLRDKVCDIESLSKYGAYDQLRCISNALKHSGIVGKELAAYDGFTEGESLSDLHDHYHRLRCDVDEFVVALRDKFIAAIS